MGTPYRSIRLVLVVVLITACGHSSPLGPDAPQGIDGLALRGPICPVAGPDCPDEPYPAEVRIFAGGGFLRVLVRAGADGRFSVGLPPGRYRVVGVSGDPFPTGEEVEVQVQAGVRVPVTLHFDTGIR